ncbi:hypothetical protein [Proteus mirabilis]|uniref:hypothetical protein n=1 Tax=Proteus mirabilis TaxID=584 RepID=UPI001F19BF6C|nr:hypothetical protein [Proteus mirabilis]MCT8216426.1 hypothetical protein [Proteus mirabilis]MDC6033421.1 hypothetical protein [Proteus mirabilis]MDC6045359.1 hypothetical protein [Proteus mirabilis]MDC6054518.1 hypothetical protein [Proteus mirabilis]MDC6065063.1 hypothetical protein [Proteus mirabilis]
MSKRKEITEETYMSYGFKRQDIIDFFHSKGKSVNFGLPPMNFVEEKEDIELISVDDALSEIQRLKAKIEELENKQPILLGKYRDNDPLLLAIEIRNSEWIKYDPENDRATRGNQQAIKKYLEDKGFTSRQAESIELVACPINR